MVISFDKSVFIKSFWLRLHQSDLTDEKPTSDFKYIKIFHNEKLIVSNTVLLVSFEWVCLVPDSKINLSGGIIGNRIEIEAGVDFDSLYLTYQISGSEYTMI